MDFKTGKTIEIIKEFLAAGGDKFEINGIDLSKAVFMYRERNSSFIPIPRGNYTTNNENNSLYLNVIGDVKTKAYEYQVIYTSDMKAGKYLEEYPELKVLVNKYNDLVEDVTNIIKYIKTSGVKIDSLKMTQVLTKLEPNTFWVMNTDEKLEAFPIGDLNSKYQEMINKIKKEVEELIKTVKEKALSDINNSATSKLNDFKNELTKKLKELETLSDELKNNLSSAVTKYIADNRDKLKGDRGPGITSITAVQDKVTVNYDDSKSTVFTVPTVPGKDGQEIKDLSYTNNKLKITMSDNSSKEVEIKNGLTLKVIFDGVLIVIRNVPFKDTVSLNDDYKICFLEFESEAFGQTITKIISIMSAQKEIQVISQQNFPFKFKIENNKIKVANESPYEDIKITKIALLI
ncbi:putative neck appendage like protein [Fusobacterium phage vB_FnuS_FNU4]|nr:putative neck appendage like protein [Fusobacterium phage vB_FnuS_FNU4]